MIRVLPSTACLTLALLLPAQAIVPRGDDFPIGKMPLVEMRVWLQGISFIGVGRISKLEVDPKTGSWIVTIAQVQAWKGHPPDSVQFSRLPPVWGMSEGQKVVFLAYKPKPKGYLGYCCPMPVFRMRGQETLRWQESHLAITDDLLAVRWERGTNFSGGPTYVLFDALCDAVLRAELVHAP
jgi:hypothetical protein